MRRSILLLVVFLISVAPAEATDKYGAVCGDDVSNAIEGIGFGARTFGGLADDRGVSIAPTPGGGFVVGGRTTSFGEGGWDLWRLLFDASGLLDSERTFGLEIDDLGGHVTVTSGGEIVIAGSLVAGTTPTREMWLQGSESMKGKLIGGDGTDRVDAIAPCLDDGIVLAGRTESFGAGANGDIWVVKVPDLNAGGWEPDWQISLGSPEGFEEAAAIEPTSDGGLVVAGSTTAFGAVNHDLWLVKLASTDGTVLWQKTYGGTDIDRPADVIETSDGDLVVAGTSYSFQVVGLSQDAWIARLDSSGAILWQYAYGTATDDYVSAIIETSDGGLVVVGSTGATSILDPQDAWIMKLDEDGDILWQKRFLGTATETETFADVAEVAQSNLIAVGRTESHGAGGSDLLLVALDPEGNLPRCDVLTDWTATRAVTSVVPVVSGDVPPTTDGFPSSGTLGGRGLTSVERDMCNPVGMVQLPRSGQSTSYHQRDDGDLQIGAVWPSPRFVDNTDGTVIDMLTGLTWLKDGDCAETIGWDPDGGGAGSLTWTSALDFANEVNTFALDIAACASYSADHTDWRLANIFEIDTLVHCGEANPAGWLETVGFENVSSGPYGYWSSTVFGMWDRMAIRFDTGELVRSYWSTKRRAWLVRGGQQDYPDPTYPANTPTTGQKNTVWQGDDGDLEMGVLWPVPRFHDHGDGTVTDGLTRLRWLKDADCFGASSWDDAFTTLADFSTSPGSYACADYVPSGLVWRLPNRKEFLSVFEHLGATSDLPAGHPFVNTGTIMVHWTSTTVAHRTDWAWQIVWPHAVASMYTKNLGNPHVWPVVDVTASAVGAGRVPDDALFPGTPLTIAKSGEGQITLDWGASCLASDTDYFIYEGAIPDYAHYGPAFCGTDGLTTKTFRAGSTVSTYYLVVPANDHVEGSYGLGVGGAERGRSVWPCVAQQNVASCF